jgi:hypothetical protein
MAAIRAGSKEDSHEHRPPHPQIWYKVEQCQSEIKA